VRLALEVLVGEDALVPRLPLPNEGGLVPAPGLDVAVDAVIGDVELPADEPLDPGRAPIQHLFPALVPVQQLCRLSPESLRVLPGTLVDRGVVDVRLSGEVFRGRVSPRLGQQPGYGAHRVSRHDSLLPRSRREVCLDIGGDATVLLCPSGVLHPNPREPLRGIIIYNPLASAASRTGGGESPLSHVALAAV